MDASNQILLIAQKPRVIGGMHFLTKVRFFNFEIFVCNVCGFSISLYKGFPVNLYGNLAL